MCMHCMNWSCCMVDWCNCMMYWSSSMVDCMVGNSMVNRGGVVGNGMVGCSMVDHRVVGVRMGNHRGWDNVSILVQDGLGQVWVEQRRCLVEQGEGGGDQP